MFVQCIHLFSQCIHIIKILKSKHVSECSHTNLPPEQSPTTPRPLSPGNDYPDGSVLHAVTNYDYANIMNAL